ncbi:MAG TPA: NUDIX hydrolase [Dehalococcoidia bacterium]|nr:NUDIX hydrolase [Dehalococcoidia bacterium]
MAIAVNRHGIELLKYSQIPESELASDIYKPLLITFMAIRHENNFLLVHHRERQTWELPGGHIEGAESARDCAVRELLEETGQRAEHLDFRAVLKYHAPPDNRIYLGIHHGIYYGTLFSGELPSPVPFRENEEISQITFWDGETDIGYIDEIDKKVIRLIQTGQV